MTTQYEIKDTTPEIVEAMKEVNAAVTAQNEANRQYDEALKQLKEAAGGAMFRFNGQFFQVRFRKARGDREAFHSLVSLPSAPSEWLNKAKVAQELKEGTEPPEVTVEKVSTDEQTVLEATGTDDVTID